MTESNEKKKKKKDAFSVVMIVQFIVCSILLAVLFFICRTNSASADTLRRKYEKLMERDFSSEDYKEAYSSASAFIKGGRIENAENDGGGNEEESKFVSMGGNDIHSDNLSVLEGISFEKYSFLNGYIKPLEDYYISSQFGYREDPISGGRGIHTGTDLACETGTEIKAVQSGKVITAEYSNGYGNYVLLAHDDGINTLYAHCSELKCSEGDIVRQGETIALAGSTGNSTGSHLHFEIRKNGIKVNPSYAVDL